MEYDQEKEAAVSRTSRRHLRRKKFSSLPADRSGLVGIAVAALILALAAFSSGVWMGKAMSDLQKSGGATASAGRENDPSASLGIATAEGPENPAEKKAEPETKKPKAEPERPKPGEVDTSESKASAATAKPKPEEAKAKPGETKTAPAPKPRFTLQVAALHNPEEARDLVAKLRGKGYPAYQITGTAAAKGTLYRVRFGQFQSLQEARQSALEFEKKEKTKTIITSLQ